MTFSTSYSRTKARKPKWGMGPFLVLFLLALAFAFGIGYQLGEDAVPAARPAPSFPSASARPASTAPYESSTSRSSAAPAKSHTLWTAVGRVQYTLYIASFQSMAEAERERARMEAKGLKGIEISEKTLSGSNSHLWYRLRYGRFSSRAAAVEQGRQLTERGLIQDFWPKELL